MENGKSKSSGVDAARVAAAPRAGRTLTHQKWEAEGTHRFGLDKMGWRFVCPCCGFVASARDYEAAGAPETAVAFSCVGRWAGAAREAFEAGKRRPGPCNYAGGGLFGLNPVTVTVEGAPDHHMFEFADEVLPAGDAVAATGELE